MKERNFLIKHSVKIEPNKVSLDGIDVLLSERYNTFLSDIYHEKRLAYPKFFKMDILCKVGFLATEILLEAENIERFVPRRDRSIIFCNKSSSVSTDLKFTHDILDLDNFYPKPSLFVYTLPNIVTGEIAIRNKYFGETNLFVMNDRDDNVISELVEHALMDEEINSVVGGWIDAESENDYEADLCIFEIKQ